MREWRRKWWRKHGYAFILGWWCSDLWDAVSKPIFEVDRVILSYIPWALLVVAVGWGIAYYIRFVVKRDYHWR
jgi:hypothetical protein